MTPNKTTLETIFANAIQQPSKEEMLRSAQAACEQDEVMLDQVKALIEAHCAAATNFLESPADGVASGLGNVARTVDLNQDAMKAGLSQAFDEKTAVVVGGTGHSVLKSLSQRTGKSLNVTLKEGPDEDSKAHTANSTEIPKTDSDSRYQLHGEIARGGMGAVLKGRDVDLGRDLAVKVLLDKHRDNPELLERFVEEAQIGGQLQHPGIVPVYELGEFKDQRPFFTMKLVKGETLAAILAKRKSIENDLPKLIGIFEQVCQTMAYAHSKGVIHRDLKPANIMVGAFGEVQVMDWGLSKVLDTGGVADEQKSLDREVSVIQTKRSAGSTGGVGSETMGGSIMGTPAYMPPEQALGETNRLDARSDVFSLGAVLAEILTGKPVYAADDFDDLVSLARRGKVNACHERLDASNAPAELIDICKKASEPEQLDRQHDASELSSEITAYLEGVQEKLKQTELARAQAETRSEEETKRKRLYMGLSGSVGIALILTGGLAWLLKNSREAVATERDYADQLRLAAEEAKNDAEQAEQTAKEALIISETQKTRAELVRIVEKSKALRYEENPITAILLLVEALELAERKNQMPFPEAHEALLEATMELSGIAVPDRASSALSVLGNRRVEILGKRLRVWNLSKDKVTPSVNYQLEFPNSIAMLSVQDRVEISADATSILVPTENGSYLVRLNDDATQVKDCTQATDTNEAFSLSPDGNMLAYRAGENWILRRNILNESSEITLGKLGRWSMPRFSPDGRWAASTVGMGAEVLLWDLSADDVQGSLSRAAVSGSKIEFSPDSRWMSVVDKVFDLRADDPFVSPYALSYRAAGAPHTDQIAFSRNGKMLAAGTTDEIWLYSLEPDGPKAKTILKRRNNGAISFSPDSHWLASGENNPTRIRLWDLSEVRSTAKRTVVLPDRSLVKIWEPIQGDYSLIPQRGPSTVLNGGGDNGYNFIEYSSDGSFFEAHSYGESRLWDFEQRLALSETILPVPENPRSICYSPDGRMLAVGCDQGVTKLFRSKDGLPVEEMGTLRSDFDGASFVRFSSSGNRLLVLNGFTESDSAVVEIWNPQKLYEPLATLKGFSMRSHRAKMSHDDRFVVAYQGPASTSSAGCYVWDLHGEEPYEPVELVGHTASVRSVLFDEETGDLISAGFDGQILRWDLTQTQPKPKELFAASEEIHQLVKTKNGFRLATKTADGAWGTVLTLDTDFKTVSSAQVEAPVRAPLDENGRFYAGTRSVWSLSEEPRLVAEHGRNALYSKCFSPDSQLYAAISHKVPGTVWVTHLPTGQTMQLDKIYGRRGHETTSFSPDSRWLATATNLYVKEIRFWDMDVDRLIERAKRLAGRELTKAERTEFGLDQLVN
ncbi:MAG: protein kinase domain-containing protein [Aureliella sp.]